ERVWELPVDAARTRPRRMRRGLVHLLQPRWERAGQAVGATAVLVYALAAHGAGPSSLLLLLLMAAFWVALLALSVLAARFGVGNVRWDVVEIVLRGPDRDPVRVPPFSLSAALVQILLMALTFILVRVLSPDALYGSVMRPSLDLLLATLVA